MSPNQDINKLDEQVKNIEIKTQKISFNNDGVNNIKKNVINIITRIGGFYESKTKNFMCFI